MCQTLKAITNPVINFIKNKLYLIILLNIICHLSEAATIDLGTVCTDVVLNYLSTNDLQVGDEVVWISADSDTYSGNPNGDGTYNADWLQNNTSVTGFAVISMGDMMKVIGVQTGTDLAGTFGGNCPSQSDMIITVVPATVPTQCTADALQAIADQGGLEIGSSYEWIASGQDEIELTQGTDATLNTRLYVNNALVTAGFAFLNMNDLIRIEGVSVGLDDAASVSGALGYSCPDWGTATPDDLSVIQTSPPTLCTEQVIDSLEAGSPFVVGESLEWIALGDDNIVFQGLDGVSDITLLRNGMNVGSGATYQSGDNMRINFISTGFEGAESTSTATCAASALTIFQINSALPVTWLKPTQAILQNEKVSISFTTAQELNNDRFEIEHSADGYTFERIAELKGQGTTARETYYEYIHDTPVFGTNYYRIKQIDYDGSYDYSNIASVIYHPVHTQIYPNPVRDILHISSVQKLGYTLLDRDGRIVLSGSTLDQSSIDMGEISAGVYFLRLGDDVRRVVKIK